MMLVTAMLFLGAQGGGEAGKIKTTTDLIARLQHKEARVRLAAIQVATAQGANLDPPVVRALVGCLEDADVKVRRAAIQAVGELGTWAREWGGGPKLGEMLAKLCTDKSDLVRRAAVWAYGQVGIDRQEELQAIAVALKDKTPETRGQALQTLGAYLHDETPKEWRLAVEEDIATLLKDPDQRVQKVAAEQLLAAGPETVPLLKKVVEEYKGNARLWAAIVLGELGIASAEAVPALQKAIGEVPADRRTIIQQALKKIQP